MSSALFSPIELRGLTLNNRVVVSPMCQYSAVDCKPTDWHLIHYGGLSMAGTGLLITEAVAVEPRGRVTHGCMTLHDDATEAALKRVVDACLAHGNTPLAIQLGHAGRKASCHSPQNGGAPLATHEDPWETIGPSPLPFNDGWHCPIEMDRADMDAVIDAHVETAKRADRIGFSAIELHGAHGYLISSFLSPLANHRGDGYGGSPAGRMRFPLEMFEAVRAVWPEDKPLGIRINGSDWDDDGLTVEDAVAFAQALKAVDCDFIDVTAGGNSMVRPPLGPGYQKHLAGAVKAATGLPTMAVGMIRDPRLAESIVAEGIADMCCIARGFLFEPRWTWRAAYELGAEAAYPPQHQRADPNLWPQAFDGGEQDSEEWVPGASPHILVRRKTG